MTLTAERRDLEESVPLTGPPRRSARSRLPVLVGISVAVVVAGLVAGVGREPILNPRGGEQFRRFFIAAGSPRLDGEFLRLTWDATRITLAYAVLGTIGALVAGLALGAVLARPTARGGRAGRAVRRGLAIVLIPIRSVHEAVYALLLVQVLGVNPLVAVLAIAVPFGAVTARVFAQTLDAVDPTDGATLAAMGARPRTVFWYSRFPTAARDLSSYGFYRFECALRSAAVLGVIGAAGLGFQLRLSFQSLRFDEVWTLVFALVLLCGAAEAVSAWLRRTKRRAVHRWTFLGVAVVGTAWAWRELGPELSSLWSARTRGAAAELAGNLWPPIARGGIGEVAGQALDTAAMAVVAAALAVVAAIPVAFLAARGGRGVRGVVAMAARALLLVFRSIPPPIWAFVLLFVFLPGVVPAAVALGVYTFGVLARLFAEAIENADVADAARLRAMGASPVSVFTYDRLPRLAPGFAGLGLYRFEVITRETVVVGIVAAGGLGYAINQQVAAFDHAGLAGSLIALGVVTALAEWVAGRLRRALA